MNSNKCCDTCNHYKWYYDLCTLYNVKVDERQVCSDYNKTSFFLTCNQCKYEENCPVLYSYLNAACIVIQAPKKEENNK